MTVQTNFGQELVPISKLTGADYNPREMPEAEMVKLKNSLREFGFVQPVVARKEDGLIVGGHQRVAAMRLLLQEDGADAVAVGRVTVPVVYVSGLDEAKTKVLNLALNKIHGEWDYVKLADLLGSIPAVDPTLFELSGFSAREVEDIVGLMCVPSAPDEITDVDADLAEQARRLVFKLESDADLVVVTAALKKFGMTGPGNAADALVKMAQAASVKP